ncbi:CLUMA_CG015745, isoform A, partial [Clunio marinus]
SRVKQFVESIRKIAEIHPERIAAVKINYLNIFQHKKMGKMSNKSLIALMMCFYFFIEVVNCGVLADRDPRSYKRISNSNQIEPKNKRPFCNAFTGCGRKRSSEIAPPQPAQTFDDDESSVSELLELNSEPAIENLMRQIMSEAKMYEAIQEANREMFLQKLKHSNNANRIQPSTYSLQ